MNDNNSDNKKGIYRPVHQGKQGNHNNRKGRGTTHVGTIIAKQMIMEHLPAPPLVVRHKTIPVAPNNQNVKIQHVLNNQDCTQ